MEGIRSNSSSDFNNPAEVLAKQNQEIQSQLNAAKLDWLKSQNARAEQKIAHKNAELKERKAFFKGPCSPQS